MTVVGEVSDLHTSPDNNVKPGQCMEGAAIPAGGDLTHQGGSGMLISGGIDVGLDPLLLRLVLRQRSVTGRFSVSLRGPVQERGQGGRLVVAQELLQLLHAQGIEQRPHVDPWLACKLFDAILHAVAAWLTACVRAGLCSGGVQWLGTYGGLWSSAHQRARDTVGTVKADSSCLRVAKVESCKGCIMQPSDQGIPRQPGLQKHTLSSVVMEPLGHPSRASCVAILIRC